MAGAIYDAGALVAAERDDVRMWATHRELIEEGVVPVVPAPVLAQAWRGGSRQALLARLLGSCEVEDMDEARSRAIGSLCGRAGHHDIADVAVIEASLRRGDVVVTSDPRDLERVASAVGSRLYTIAV